MEPSECFIKSYSFDSERVVVFRDVVGSSGEHFQVIVFGVDSFNGPTSGAGVE